MQAQEMPQFSEDSKEEFTAIMVKFFRKHLPEEACSSIMVEVKLKPQSQPFELQEQEIRTVLKSGCRSGWSGPPCLPGENWQTWEPRE